MISRRSQESREEEEETRKERDDWKKLNLEVEMWDLLSSKSEENGCKEERSN